MTEKGIKPETERGNSGGAGNRGRGRTDPKQGQRARRKIGSSTYETQEQNKDRGIVGR